MIERVEQSSENERLAAYLGEDENAFCLLAGRESFEEVAQEAEVLEQVPLLVQTLNAMPYMVMVLNARRQIVAANEAMLGILGTATPGIPGKRPGEAMGCIWATEGPDGCGTGKHCVTCGAVQAILESGQAQKRIVHECRILIGRNEETMPLDLRVTATPFTIENAPYIVLAVEDISQAKRLSVLQRTFFHDVLNTAGCIQGYMQFLDHDDPVYSETRQRLAHLTTQIVAEIESQRDLLAAETGDYQVQPTPLRTTELLDELCAQYRRHTAATGRTLALASCRDEVIVSDSRLLLRVLGNMVKNALEATGPGGAVAVGCAATDDSVTFMVHNPESMTPEVQLQVFQRSFSTKGESGRGIGAYSMKLFGERYLAGKVGFTSSPTEGTTFHLTLPKSLSVYCEMRDAVSPGS